MKGWVGPGIPGEGAGDEGLCKKSFGVEEFDRHPHHEIGGVGESRDLDI